MDKNATPIDPSAESQRSLFFAAALGQDKDPNTAAGTALEEVSKHLDGRKPQIVFLFVSILYRAAWKPILRRIRAQMGEPLLIGCTGGGVLGADQELEGTPALSLAAGCLPEVRLHPFTVEPDDLSKQPEPGFWIEKIGASPSQEPVGILLAEPFSCDCMSLVHTLNAVYPKMPLIGGLASGARHAGENALFFNEEVVPEGAAGLLMTGNIAMQTIVSQGCRPIGRPFVVTKAEENVLLELGGIPATEALRQLYTELSETDKALAQRALLLGVVMNEYQQTFKRGDFLIRNLIGMDPSVGAIAVGDRIQTGQTVQFHVRDAGTSREDLQTLLKEQAPAFLQRPAAGALLFSCLGRGKDLYGEPHVDIRAIRGALGSFPIGGFFCNGEIGPIGTKNYIHGFTSSLGLFRPRQP